MIIEYFGDDKLPALMLIHEGGLGAWMWRPVIERLKQDYWVLTPVLDGHGPDAGHDFATIAQCAGQIESFIQSRLRGQKLYLAGCGLGGQIACELLSRSSHAAQAAVIEDAQVIPSPKARQRERFGKLQWKLSKMRPFALRRAKSLGLPQEMQNEYLRDVGLISQVSYRRMLHETLYYTLPVEFKNTSARILALHSEADGPSLGFSAQLMARNAGNCRIQALPGKALCLKEPETYVNLIHHFFKEENP